MLFTLPLITKAQQANNKIAYGETASGEITNRNFEIAYDFVGKKGDVIVVEMKPVDKFGDLNSPAIILLDADADVIADTSSIFVIGSTALATKLRSDGTYTILATRNDGRAGTSVGEFTLALIQPTLLEPKETTKDTVSSEDETKYYLIEGGSEPIGFTYHKISGEYSPEISVNIINDNFGLSEIITLKGSALEKGMVEIPAAARTSFIVKIGAPLFNFSFEESNANYEVTTTINA